MDCRRAARWAGYVSYSGARGACRFCSEPIVTGLRTGLASVRFATGPKRSMGHFLGAEKEIFLSRDIDDATRAGASVESCRFVVPEVSWSRLGSVLVACKRLRRTRGRSHRWIHISTGPQQCAETYHDPPKFWIQSSLGSPKHYRMRCRRLPDPRPTPRDVQEPISPRKKCAIWTRWLLVPGKNANYLRAPSSRRSGLVGPYTTPPIVNYKYRTSTL